MERGKGIPRLLHNRRRAMPTPTFQLSLLRLLLYFACCFHVVLGNEEEFGIGSALSVSALSPIYSAGQMSLQEVARISPPGTLTQPLRHDYAHQSENVLFAAAGPHRRPSSGCWETRAIAFSVF